MFTSVVQYVTHYSSVSFTLVLWLLLPSAILPNNLFRHGNLRFALSSASGPNESRVDNSRKLVDIFVFHKDEGDLLLDWGTYHGQLFGYDSIHIIDHRSADPKTITNLRKLQDLGANVRTFNGNFKDKHEELSNLMRASNATFYIPLDTDEFLVFWEDRTIVCDGGTIREQLLHLPEDGRRYRLQHIQAVPCSEHRGHLLGEEYSRPREMTTFLDPGGFRDCRTKSFFWYGSFQSTDQGNHHGKVTTDEMDMKMNYMVKGCPYFHSPSLGLVHFGTFLPWEMKLSKMMRGAKVYGHHHKVNAGGKCSGIGVHYCRFYERLRFQGEKKFRREYESSLPCNSSLAFHSFSIASALDKTASKISVQFSSRYNAPIKRAFLVGISHSGTSILERIVGNIPLVAALCKETEIFLGKPFKRHDPNEVQIQSYIVAFDQEASQRGAKLWLEKTPRHIFFLSKILQLIPDAYIIWITRDPLQVALSLKKRGLGVHCQGKLTGCSEYWANGNAHAMQALSNGRNVLNIKFEELYSYENVLLVLQELYNFLGLRGPVAPTTLESIQPHTMRTCYRFKSEQEKEQLLFQSWFKNQRRKENISAKYHAQYRAEQMSMPWTVHEPYTVAPSDAAAVLTTKGTLELAIKLGYEYPSCVFKENRSLRQVVLDYNKTGYKNINGPSVIRSRPWMRINHTYIMYYAGHRGKQLRISVSEKVTGPWKVLSDVLLSGFMLQYSHVASPDAIVDDVSRTIRLYFHAAIGKKQRSYVGTSSDGVAFTLHTSRALAPFYLRIFQLDGVYFGLAKNNNNGTLILRSESGLDSFVPGPLILPKSRHTSVLALDERIFIFYSVVGESPERIYYTEIINKEDIWTSWKEGIGVPVLEPELPFEGAQIPMSPSTFGPSSGFLRQVQDPYVLVDAAKLYLFYSAGGEHAIGITQLEQHCIGARGKVQGD